MTTQYSLARAISGQTGVVAKLFAVGTSDDVLYTSASGQDGTNKKGQYTLTWETLVTAGNYTQIMFSSSGIPLSIGDRTFLGTDGETATTRAAELDSASVTAIRDGIPKVGETHRYTQVDSGATTTDVSIGAAT